MIAALAFLVVGGVLVYSAFQTPPDPRDVVGTFFGFAPQQHASKGATPGSNPRGERGQV